jgi:topoisomerase-4 subunit B
MSDKAMSEKTTHIKATNNKQYNANSIEVLSGLDPVRKRPGMYTETTRPNHLAQEVIDNSVDEALAGHADKIEVVLFADGSLSVTDNGRGMPVDIHTEEGVPGVELILTRLHAGGKFSNDSYTFSGGLHGVGVSVVNALTTKLEVLIRRDGQLHRIAFANGDKTEDLNVIGTVGKRNTGTEVRFWPDEKYFDTVRFSVSRLRHVLRAKAVLCPGLSVTFTNEQTNEKDEWFYEDGLKDYLLSSTNGLDTCPTIPFTGSMKGNTEAADWAIQWLVEGGELIQESYVNLIGSHERVLRIP